MPSSPDPAEPFLVPRPRRLVVHAGQVVDLAAVPVERHTGASLPPEGYTIDVRPDAVRVVSADPAGARHAEATLSQLATAPGGVAPMEVKDHPDHTLRGYMLDISRDRVPTRAALERLVAVLALCRFTQLQLYTEHTFAYADHETVWRHASPLTCEDLRWLDGVCAAAGIELVANQNVFGHMGRWLAHDEYRHRAETPDGFELLPGMVVPPGALAPSEDNARFALDLLEELLGCVSSRRVHIGCDEVMELGAGASAAAVAAASRGRVFVDHVRRIAAPLVAAGHEVWIWDDMVRHEPELVDDLPDGVVLVPWTYERPRPAGDVAVPAWFAQVMGRLGHDDPAMAGGFGPILDRYRGLDRPTVLAPGTSTWNSLVGRLDNARANLADACAAARHPGALGVLVTDWGDNGHLQPPVVSLPAVVSAGALAWCAEANADLDVAAVVDRHVLGDPSGGLGAVLERVGQQWGRVGQEAINASPLQAALVPDAALPVFGDPDPSGVATVVDALDEALDAIGRASPTGAWADAGLELTAAVRLARQGAWRLAERAGLPGPDATARRADLAEAIELQRAAWASSSRPGGLDDSVAPLVRQLR